MAWLLSLFRKPYDNLNARPELTDFSDFIRTQWIAVRRENGPSVYSDPIEIWNRKAAAYLKFVESCNDTKCKALFLKAEDVTTRQTFAIGELANFLNMPSTKIAPIKESTKDKGRDSAYYKEYYGQNKWLEQYNQEDFQYVIDRIDWRCAQLLGYDMPEIATF